MEAKINRYIGLREACNDNRAKERNENRQVKYCDRFKRHNTYQNNAGRKC